MKSWIQSTVLGCGILLAMGFIGIVSLVIIFRLLTPYHFDDSSFDREIWLASASLQHPDNPRGQMYDDLYKRHLSKKMSKAEVIALLGNPDTSPGRSRFSYLLGMWSGMRMDYDTLEIEFDDQDRLKRAYRIQH